MQPKIPALNARPEKEHLQAHVCVELNLEEQNAKRADTDDARRPGPDVLLHAEINAEQTKDDAGEFERGQGRRWIDNGD